MLKREATLRGMRNIVWEGRFQPIHVGHVAYVERLLEHADTCTVVVVANESSTSFPASSVPVPWFSQMVDTHHRQEKNPWPLRQRVHLVKETLATAFGREAVDVVAGHRLDLDWALWDQLLPEDRIFVTPLRDEFEDAKARAWDALGQTVERLDVHDLPKVSATDVRARMTRGGSLEPLMHPRTIQMLEEYGYARSDDRRDS